ncbi:hypothetical protein ACCS55_09125 [Rhizobium ruizarguesonis]
MKTGQASPTSDPDKAIGHVLATLDQQLALHGLEIDALKQHIDSLVEKVREKEKAVSRIREARRQLALLQPTSPTDENSAIIHTEVPDDFAKRQKQRKSSQAWQVRQQAYRILKETGHPLSRAEILAKMEADGFVVDSPRPGPRVGKILWDAKDAFIYRDNGYWLVGEPVTEPVERIKRFRTGKPRKKKPSAIDNGRSD